MVYNLYKLGETLTVASQCGEAALSNPIWLAASEHHEMPFYIQNDWPSAVRDAWALDAKDEDPTLLGSTQLLALQKFVHTRLAKHQKMDGLEDAGKAARAAAIVSSASGPVSRSKVSKIQKKLDESAPPLAGGLRIVEDLSPKKKRKSSSSASERSSGSASASQVTSVKSTVAPANPMKAQMSGEDDIGQVMLPEKEKVPELSSKTPTSNLSELSSTSAKILSTASSKLSYLITQVVMYQKSEKIIIFYEADNVAYYIAQALEAINVEHLIYAKSLSSDRRSSYIVTFNQSPRFRVLLMDISQAAFGLDVSSASRVYFVNPVFNKQVEAQAVKRAHRIGQFRSVYVETLVLRGSIEEVIIERRKVMSSEEQKKCKTVLDDETMYDWIKNVRFVPLPQEEMPGPDQMATLKIPQPVFNHNKPADGAMNDPDAGLVLEFLSSPFSKRKGKRKASAIENPPAANNAAEPDDDTIIVFRTPAKKRQKTVSFAFDDAESSEANISVSTPKNIQTLRQLNATPCPCGPLLPSPSREEFLSASPSREESPSKAERSRLDILGARSLLARFRSEKSPSPGPDIGSSASSRSWPSTGMGPGSGSGSGSAAT